ncbi:MAG: GNAT family N-acetyltransferase [Alphaproteobacteria bacterium]|nr:GNAT family N-acetyltransferase [Alphaproteobacteria bacterium]
MIRIEPATPASLPAILAMLPHTADHHAMHFAAMANDEIVGAAALQWQGLHSPPGFGFTLFVRPAWRCWGIGRAIIAAMATAASGETAGLWSAARHVDGSPAAAFLTRLGFAPAQRDLHFRMDGQRFLDHVDDIIARLRRLGRVPAAAATLRLRDAPFDQLAMLLANNFRQQPATIAARLALALHDPLAAGLDPDVSTVTLEAGTVVGALLVRMADDVGQIDCNVVAAHRRRSWVNALQLAETTRRGLAVASRIGFHSDSRMHDSINLATRSGGTLLFSEARYWRAMDDQAAVAA